MNRKVFFDKIRASFDGGLTQSRVDGITAILDEAEKRKTPLNWLAYMFATVFHETAQTMQPVRETLADTDEKAIARLEKAWADGKLSWVKKPYWRKDANGKSWLGRGFVQITHEVNYEKFGIKNPDDAMHMGTALRILFDGMEKGMFTGKKLADYCGANPDYIEARRLINGKDRAKDIAGYAKMFEAALIASGYGSLANAPVIAQSPNVVPKIAESPKPFDLLNAILNIITALIGGRK